ncbi:MAG: hypothetical protein B7Z71_11450 [Acidocella sp. 21-58-7]|nr:MAG: hypothetical protein B7Z71_11450 [Acidocella sp. 21-58-7]
MNRRALTLLLIIALPLSVWAKPAMAAGFDTQSAASVWGAALSYIAPRALEALSIPQMTLWGLNGLTALDPDLKAQLQDNQIRLYGPEQLLIAVPAPAAEDAQGWGNAAAAVANAAFAASPALQQAGTPGIIESFFDELFNHFDPYSRYEPPLQAAQDQLLITGIAGTGLTFGRQDNKVVITAVAAASPAAEAGLTVGTILLALNGHPAYPSQVASLNGQLNGILGSQVILRIVDPAADASGTDITLTRALVPAQTVFNESGSADIPGALILKTSIKAPANNSRRPSKLGWALPSPPMH